MVRIGSENGRVTCIDVQIAVGQLDVFQRISRHKPPQLRLVVPHAVQVQPRECIVPLSGEQGFPVEAVAAGVEGVVEEQRDAVGGVGDALLQRTGRVHQRHHVPVGVLQGVQRAGERDRGARWRGQRAAAGAGDGGLAAQQVVDVPQAPEVPPVGRFGVVQVLFQHLPLVGVIIVPHAGRRLGEGGPPAQAIVAQRGHARAAVFQLDQPVPGVVLGGVAGGDAPRAAGSWCCCPPDRRPAWSRWDPAWPRCW